MVQTKQEAEWDEFFQDLERSIRALIFQFAENCQYCQRSVTRGHCLSEFALDLLSRLDLIPVNGVHHAEVSQVINLINIRSANVLECQFRISQLALLLVKDLQRRH